MRILMPTIWFHRGASYVTKTLRDILVSLGHDVFIFARTGGVYGVPKLETDNEWNVPNLITYPEYKINSDDLIKCIKDNDISCVIYNEEYDLKMIYDVKKNTGVKTITYLDYYKADWKEFMSVYDDVWCSTKRSFNVVKDICNASYIGWGIDTDLFKPSVSHRKKFTFFINGGWLGINNRKGVPEALLAFDEACKHNYDITLLVHTQVGLDVFPPSIINIINNNDRIKHIIGTFPHPGFYNEALWYLAPSKLEGLGLPLLEALSSGLPCITTNSQPMNEFIINNYNGYLIGVDGFLKREDNLYFEEAIINHNSFVEILLNISDRIKMSVNARKFIVDNFTMDCLKNRIGCLL